MCTVCRLHAVYLFVFFSIMRFHNYVYSDVRRVFFFFSFFFFAPTILRVFHMCRFSGVEQQISTGRFLKVTSKINQRGGYNITR